MLLLCSPLISCSDNSHAANPTGGGPGITPAVFYQGRLYVERYLRVHEDIERIKFEKAATVVNTVSEEWPEEELYASALDPGTVIYYGINPNNGEHDGYLYVQYNGSYIRLAAE